MRPKCNAERIDPDGVQSLRITRRDVSRDALVEAELRKEPERSGEPLLAVQALLFGESKVSIGDNAPTVHLV